MRKATQNASPGGSGGFTLMELVIAVGVGSLVIAMTMMVFLTSVTVATDCRLQAQTQAEAVQSSQKLVTLARNAMGVHRIDGSGDWVELSMPPTGAVCRIEYENPTREFGRGRIVFVAEPDDPGSSAIVVVENITKVPLLPVRNVFELLNPDSLMLSYRIMRRGRKNIASTDVTVGARFRNQ